MGREDRRASESALWLRAEQLCCALERADGDVAVPGKVPRPTDRSRTHQQQLDKAAPRVVIQLHWKCLVVLTTYTAVIVL